ncbi:MAG: DUF4373 domain-containing protein [Mangrovibacterium sp.]
MARPTKKGISYFPLDVDFFEDEKIEAIGVYCGALGELAAVKLLCMIYRNGYYMAWNEVARMKLIKGLNGVSEKELDAVIEKLVEWQFFSPQLFHEQGILSSKAIQRRFHEITKRRKLTQTELPYWILANEHQPNELAEKQPALLSAETTLKHAEIPQRKEKEKKGKKNKSSSKAESSDVLENLEESTGKNHLPLAHHMMQFFGYNEQQNFSIMREFVTMLNCLQTQNRLDYFHSQFQSYIAYKKASGERVHSWRRFIGTPAKNYADGGWNASNWQQCMQERQARKQLQQHAIPSHMKHRNTHQNDYGF